MTSTPAQSAADAIADSIDPGTLLDVAAEGLAQRFHETYERLAPSFGYATRRESAVPWDQVPEQNRNLMVAVCRELLSSGDVSPSGILIAEYVDADPAT